MGIGNYPFEVLSQIQGIASHLLAQFTTDQVIKSFSGVAEALEAYKRNHSDQIPTKFGGGLLSTGPIPVNDFELAQHLINTNDLEMVRVKNESDGVPVLMAYLAVICSSRNLPDESLLASALPYAVSARTLDGDVAKLWNKELLPLAEIARKHVASQAGRRAGKTKLTEFQKKQVVREYKAASVTYGMVKSLARKYDVSEDTISRIVNPRSIQKQTKQD